MEAYKSTCKSCGAIYFWTGYKTGLGKTEAQLKAMRQRETICRECGAEGLKTELDRESETGKAYDEMDRHAAELIGQIISGKINGTDMG